MVQLKPINQFLLVKSVAKSPSCSKCPFVSAESPSNLQWLVQKQLPIQQIGAVPSGSHAHVARSFYTMLGCCLQQSHNFLLGHVTSNQQICGNPYSFPKINPLQQDTTIQFWKTLFQYGTSIPRPFLGIVTALDLPQSSGKNLSSRGGGEKINLPTTVTVDGP